MSAMAACATHRVMHSAKTNANTFFIKSVLLAH